MKDTWIYVLIGIVLALILVSGVVYEIVSRRKSLKFLRKLAKADELHKQERDKK